MPSRRPRSAPPAPSRADAGTWRYTRLRQHVVPATQPANALDGWANESAIDVRAIASRQSKAAAAAGEAAMPSAAQLVVRPRSTASVAVPRKHSSPPRRAVEGAHRAIGDGWVRVSPQDTSVPVYFWHSGKRISQWAHPLKSEDPGRALLTAAAAGDVQEASRCLRTGASVNTADVYGRTVLEHAVKASSAGIVDLLLRYGPPELEARNRYGRTALHAAVCHSRISVADGGDAGCIGLLLSAGADANAMTSDGRTPHELLAAARVSGANSAGRSEADFDAVHELLAVGVDAWNAAQTASRSIAAAETQHGADAGVGESIQAEPMDLFYHRIATPGGPHVPHGQVVWGGREEDLVIDDASHHGVSHNLPLSGYAAQSTEAVHAAAKCIQAAHRGHAARAMLVVHHRSSGGSALFRNRGASMAGSDGRMSIAKEIAWERRSAVIIQSKARGMLARRAARRLRQAVDSTRGNKQNATAAAANQALTTKLVPNDSGRFVSLLSSKPVSVESLSHHAPQRSAGGNINANGGVVNQRPRSAFAETRRQAATGRVLRRPPRPMSAGAARDNQRARSRARRLDEIAALSRYSATATTGNRTAAAAVSTLPRGLGDTNSSGGMSLRPRQRPSTGGAQRSKQHGDQTWNGGSKRPGSAPAGRGGVGWKSSKTLAPLSVGVPAFEGSIGEIPLDSSTMGTIGQVSAIPSELLDFDSRLNSAGVSFGEPSSATSHAAATGATSTTTAAAVGTWSSKTSAPTANPSGGVETWVSMTQESQLDYSAAIESLLSVALESEASGAVPQHCLRAWTKACDIAVAHGTAQEIAATLGTVIIRFANIGDTWNAMHTFQRTIAWDQEREKQRSGTRGKPNRADSRESVGGNSCDQNPSAEIGEDPGSKTEETARAATSRLIEAHCDWRLAAQIYSACGDHTSANRLAAAFGSPPGSPGSPLGSPSGSPSRPWAAGPGASDPAISEAIAAGEYEKAHELAERSMNKRTVRAVHVRCAERRIELGEYENAEVEFVAGGAAKMAVEMWISLRDFDRATQCSRTHEPSMQPRVAAARRESNFRRHVMLGDLKRGGVSCAVPYATSLRVLVCGDLASQPAVQELNAKALPKLVEHGRSMGIDVLLTATDNRDPTRTSAVELQERLESGSPVLFLSIASRNGDALALPQLLSTAEFRELGDILRAKEGQLVVALRRRFPHTKSGRAGSALTPPLCNATTVVELLTEVYPCDRNAVPPHHLLRSSEKLGPLGLSADVQALLCETIGECVAEHLPKEDAGATPLPRARTSLGADEEGDLVALNRPHTPEPPANASMRTASPSSGTVSPASSRAASPVGGRLIGRARVDMAARRSLALKFNLTANAMEVRSVMGVLGGRGADHMICYTRVDSPSGSKPLPRSAVLRDSIVKASIPKARTRQYCSTNLAMRATTDENEAALTEAEELERLLSDEKTRDASYLSKLVADVIRDVKLCLAREHAARPGRKWPPRLAEIPRHLRQVYAAGQRGIVGRSRLLRDINAALRKPLADGDAPRPLVLEAYAPGGGRSSVVAAAAYMATQQMYRWGDVPEEGAVIGPGAVMVRFLRSSRYGVTVRQLLTSLIQQLNEIASLGVSEEDALIDAMSRIRKAKDKAYGMAINRPPSPQSPGSDQGSPGKTRQMERHIARLNEQDRTVRKLQDQRMDEHRKLETERQKQRSEADADIASIEEKLAEAEAAVEFWERKVAQLLAEEEDAIVLGSGLAASGAVDPLIEAMDARALHIANRPEREWQPIGRVAAEARLDDLKLDALTLRDELRAKRQAYRAISSKPARGEFSGTKQRLATTDIVARFTDALERAAAATNSFDPIFSKALWIFLDSVDDLCKDEEFPDLTWIPAVLPKGCRLIVSCTRGRTSAEAQAHLDSAQCDTLRWKAAKDTDVKYMNDQWLLSARRKLTEAQESAVNAVWAATLSPLCVRLTVHDALRWSSYEVRQVVARLNSWRANRVNLLRCCGQDPTAALSSQDLNGVDLEGDLVDPRTPVDAVGLEVPTGELRPGTATFQALHGASLPAPKDAETVVSRFLESLERRFGRTLVAHTSAYFTASRVGLSEMELLELFTISANNLASQGAGREAATNRLAKQDNAADVRAAARRAVALQHLLRELRPYLAERAPQVLRWRHAVFEHVSRERHARYLPGSHLALAAFFSGRTGFQPLILPKSQLEPARYNLRVLEELPWQLAKTVSDKQAGWPLQVLRTTVATLAFMEAACASDMVVGVLRTFSRIESALQAELTGHWQSVADNAIASGEDEADRKPTASSRKSRTQMAPSTTKRPGSAARERVAASAGKEGTRKLRIATDADEHSDTAERAKDVQDGLLRLRNLLRFGAAAQLGDGGWGTGPSAWSTVQEALNAPEILWESVMSEASEAVGIEFEHLPVAAGPFAHQRHALPPAERELEMQADREQRGRLLSALPSDAVPQVLLRRRSASGQVSAHCRTLHGPSGPVTAVMFMGARAVVAGCMDGQLRIWDASTAVCLQNWPHGWNGTPAITAIAQTSIPASYSKADSSPDTAIPGRLLASAAEDGTVALWLLQSVVPGLVAMIPRYIGVHDGSRSANSDTSLCAVRSVEFGCDGQILASGGDDGTVQLRLTDEIGKTHAPPLIAGVHGDSAVLCMVWSHDSNYRVSRRTSTASLFVGHANGELTRFLVSLSRLLAGVSLADPVLLQKWSAHAASPVRALAISPHAEVAPTGDVKLLVASASDDGLLKLWHIHAAATPVIALKTDDNALEPIAALPSEIRVNNTNGELQAALPRGVEALASLEGHSGPVYSCCFHPAGHTLASGSEDEQIRLWNISTKPGFASAKTASQESSCLGQLQFACTHVLDVNRGTQQEEVSALAYSPDGGYIVSGQSDHATHLWEPRLFPTQADVDEAAMDSFDSQDVANRLAGAAHDTVSVDVSPDGRSVLAANGRNATVWSFETGNPQTPCEHLDVVSCAAFSPDGNLVATGSNDEVVRVWTANEASLVKVFAARFELVQGKLSAPGENYAQKRSQKKSSHHAVRDVAWSSCGRRVAAACWDRMVRVWDVQSSALLCTMHGHAHWLTAVAFSSDSKEVIAAGDDGTVRVWDAPSGRVDEMTALVESYPRSAGSAPKSRAHHTLAIVLPPKVTLTDAASGNQLKTLCCTDGIVAAGSADGGVYLWHSKGYVSLGCFQPPPHSELPLCGPTRSNPLRLLGPTTESAQAAVTSVAASPDGALLAVAYANRWLRIWQLASGAAIGAMRMPRVCAAVAFSPNRAEPRLVVACASEVRWYDLLAWKGMAQFYPGILESAFLPQKIPTKAEILAEQKRQDDDQPDAIFARAVSRGLATPATVATMRKSIDAGELDEQFYAQIWRKRLADHDERERLAKLAQEQEERRLVAAEAEAERIRQAEEAAEKEAKKFGKKR